MALRGVDNPPRPRLEAEDPAGEAEAYMRIANCIAEELPAITNPHWHEALTSIRRQVVSSAQLLSQRPTFGLVDGEAS